jgi:hypothetical protein
MLVACTSAFTSPLSMHENKRAYLVLEVGWVPWKGRVSHSCGCDTLVPGFMELDFKGFKGEGLLVFYISEISY